MMNENKPMPKHIWAAYFGGGKIWGDVTEKTHPDNTQYIRSDTAEELLGALKDIIRWSHWANEKLGFDLDPVFPEYLKAKAAIKKAEGKEYPRK